MSLSATPCRNDAIGNNTTLVFDFSFQIVEPSDLLVVKRDLLGNETILILNTDYSVDYTLYDPSGSITLIAGALPTNYALMIRRNAPIQQETDIRNQGAYYPETIEDEFDSLAMVDQQQEEEISRSFKMSETELLADFNPEMPYGLTQNPSCVIGINGAGNGLQIGPTFTQIANAAAESAAAAASASAAAASAATAASYVSNVVEVDTSVEVVNKMLPAANLGKQVITFINETFGGSHNVVVGLTGSDTLMGLTTPDDLTPGEIGTYYSNGVSKWYRLY